MFKSVFLLAIIFCSVAFTPLSFGQELQKAALLENITIIYDQSASKTVITSVTLETVNNNAILIPDELLDKLSTQKDIRFVTFTNMGECVMGVSSNEQCIIVKFNLETIKGDGGINAIQTNATEIGNELISDLNNMFNLNAKFHSIWIEGGGDKDAVSMLEDTATGGTVSATYTMPKQETNVAFNNMSKLLLAKEIRGSGGFYEIAKQLANQPGSILSVTIVQDEERPLFLFKVSKEYKDEATDISIINPLGIFDISELERTELFNDYFVPLNSIVRVLIIPENPVQINKIKSDVIDDLSNADRLSNPGWFFTYASHDKIDARFLFGATNSVSADKLVMELGPWDAQNEDDFLAVNTVDENLSEQYAILAVIIVVAVGAALFYLKGYKRNH